MRSRFGVWPPKLPCWRRRAVQCRYFIACISLLFSLARCFWKRGDYGTGPENVKHHESFRFRGPICVAYARVQSLLIKVQGLATASHAFLREHWRRALRIREKIRFSEEAFHLILAGGVGVMGGLVNLLFYYSIESVKYLFYRLPGHPVEVAELMSGWGRVLTPTLGGLGAGLVLYWG